MTRGLATAWTLRSLLGLALAGALAALPWAAPAQPAPPEPETATGWQDKDLVTADRQMVVAAHPLAAEAGLEMLRRGGSAVDAAIAVQMVLNLVEPQSSGIGGGGFMVHWDQAAWSLTTYDGRETAPAAARPDRFLDGEGERLDFRTAVRSGRSVGVPGLLRMLEMAHARHGRLPWRALFAPAIALAEQGFPVSTRLALLLRWHGRESFAPEAQRYFFDIGGRARAPGEVLVNPAFAATLRAVAAHGADAFYGGPIARDIVAAVNEAPLSLGDMRLYDLARYKAKERAPVCISYRAHEICGMGPPSSGALTVAMALTLVEPFDLGTEPLNVDAVHLLAEAQKLAYADRNRYLADSDFVSIPDGLLDTGYLDRRRAMIDPDRAMPRAPPGEPPGLGANIPGRDGSLEAPGTSHISIVDADGNAVAMTTTIEGAFGSGLMVRGFLLNNELTDFSFAPLDEAGRPVANRVEGGKRPRSSMAPTIVFGPGRSVSLVTGSPGGSQIILYVIKAIVAHIDWRLDPQSAAALTNFGSRNGPLELELGLAVARLALRMRLRGHEVRTGLMTSGLHTIAVADGILYGGADPRRDGVAVGD